MSILDRSSILSKKLGVANSLGKVGFSKQLGSGVSGGFVMVDPLRALARKIPRAHTSVISDALSHGPQVLDRVLLLANPGTTE